MAISIGLELGPSAIQAVVVERASRRSTARAVPTGVSASPSPPHSGSAGSRSASRLPSQLLASAAGTFALRVVATHEAPCDTANPESLTRTLTQIRRALTIASPIVLGLPSSAAILTTISPLIANSRRAVLAVQFELQQQLPFELTDAAWHYQWLPTNGRQRSGLARPGDSYRRAGGARGSGRRESSEPSALSLQRSSSAVVAAIRRLLLEERLACCRRAGLTVHAVTLNPLAALNAWDAARRLARSGDTPDGSASGGTVETGMTLLRLISDQAAEWVVWTPETIQVIPVLSPSADALWEDLAVSCQVLRAQDPQAAGPVRLVGPATLLPRACEIVTAQLGRPADRLDISHALTNGATAGPEPGVCALGLALQGLGMARVSLNFLTSSQEASRFHQVRHASRILSACCAAAVVVFGLSGMAQMYSRRLHLLRTLEYQERLYQTLRPDVRTLIQRQERTLQRIRRLQQLVVSSTAVTELLAQASEALPDDVWLTTFKGTRTAAVEGMLEGRGSSFQAVTRFLDRLKNTSGMSQVKPLSTNVVTDQASSKEMIVFTVQVQRAAPEEPTSAPSDAPRAPKAGTAHGRREPAPAKAEETAVP